MFQVTLTVACIFRTFVDLDFGGNLTQFKWKIGSAGAGSKNLPFFSKPKEEK